ncbi:hypothetical protein [Teichococcus wenyumeiae]|uniref:hypothetical protein n=1 Tax=Teichococcus wenyumeiae TaxID=2478470 RepID=UPI0011C47046|nr:hypothetical protein [Pseudoroseomonas wenyumeiae]
MKPPVPPAPTTTSDLSPAAIHLKVAELWEMHGELDRKATAFSKAGDQRQADAHHAAADDTYRQLRTLEELGTQVRPTTLRDAVAQLTMIHAAIYTSVINADDGTEREVAAQLQNSVWSLAVIARHCGYDLAYLGGFQLTETEVKIARGEMPA